MVDFCQAHQSSGTYKIGAASLSEIISIYAA